MVIALLVRPDNRDVEAKHACDNAQVMAGLGLLGEARRAAAALAKAGLERACAAEVLAHVRGEEYARTTELERARTYRRAAVLARGERLLVARRRARDEALGGYLEALRHDPYHRGAHHGLVLWLKRQAGVSDTAAANTRCVVGERLTRIGILDVAGVAYSEAFRGASTPRCVEGFELLRFRRDWAFTLVQRAEAVEKTGDRDAARRSFANALNEDAGLARARRGLERVAVALVQEPRGLLERVGDRLGDVWGGLTRAGKTAWPYLLAAFTLAVILAVPISRRLLTTAREHRGLAGVLGKLPRSERFLQRQCALADVRDANGEPSPGLALLLKRKLKSAAADRDAATGRVHVSSRPTDQVGLEASGSDSMFDAIGGAIPGASAIGGALTWAGKRLAVNGVQVSAEEARGPGGCGLIATVRGYRGEVLAEKPFWQADEPALAGLDEAAVRDALAMAAADFAMEVALEEVPELQ